MKLLALLFVAILLLAGQATAFAEAGGFERIWYYYAYLIDTDGGKNPAKTIAVDCWKDFRVLKREKPCNFNQFIEYIAIPGQKSGGTDFQVTKGRELFEPDVEETKKKLYNMGLTDLYDTLKIMGNASGKGADGIAKLMNSVTDYLSSELPGASQTYKEAVQKAALGCSRERQASSIDIQKDALQKLGWKIVLNEVPVFHDATDMVKDIDMDATIAANPEKPADDLWIARNTPPIKPDDGHQKLLIASKNGAQMASLSCG